MSREARRLVGVNRALCDWQFRRQVREQIKALQPWYQQQQLLPGLWTRPWNRETLGQWVHAERGSRKWARFVLPLIEPYLQGATVLEMGTNAGHQLLLALRGGARFVMGVEPDPHYLEQAKLVRQVRGVVDRMALFQFLPLAERHLAALPVHEQRVDIGLLCAVLRHIPDGERVETVARMGRLCSRLLIQGNGMWDAPKGDSAETIFTYLQQAGLLVEQMRCEPHVRGLVVVARRRMANG